MGCYYINGEHVCHKCLTPGEFSDVPEEDMFSDEDMAIIFEDGAIIECARCGREIKPYKEDEKGG